MKQTLEFRGYTKECPRFFLDLRRNNNKTWFDAHRAQYDEHVVAPSRAFVLAMGGALSKLSPHIIAEPKVNGSLFRLHRDIRFSSDKTPYKTHMAIYFWEGRNKRMENPGYYLHLEPPKLMLGVGVYQFPKGVLPRYREAAADETHGSDLAEAVRTVVGRGYGIGVPHYKRVPRGFDPAHPNAALLRFSGLTAMTESEIPDAFLGPELVDHCFEHFRNMDPVVRWLVGLAQRVG